VSSDDLQTLPFCICGEMGASHTCGCSRGVTIVLVGDTALSESARIDPPSTEELDNARYASPIPRSFVDHTKACTYGDELRIRRFIVLR
jgi:hypothetical protein